MFQRIFYWVEWFDLVLCDNWFESNLTRWGHDSFHIIDEFKYSDWCIFKIMVALSSKLTTTKLTNFLFAYHEISWSIFRNNHMTNMEYGIQVWCRMVVIHNINMKGVQQMKWSSSGHMVAIAMGRDITLLSASNWKLVTTLKVNQFFYCGSKHVFFQWKVWILIYEDYDVFTCILIYIKRALSCIMIF